MTDIIDKAARALSAGLMLFGIVVLGLVETLAGQPFAPAPMTNEAGDVVATPLIAPEIRTGFVLAGIAVLGLYAAYRLVAPLPDDRGVSHETMAD
ncbi:hypothetical protein DVK05_03320 [Halorubrum sp. Atlit-8R]|uniref:hypothetical protein n=1 Tax=unclassified Halorubrum TaxID=2642239 RepID=UPI000EF27AE4|nr:MULTISPECIES: hypothetical protein [unclassified Halorubrum]RLM71014.1 hypothetical protein DVK08_02440 [Halorubrum sp. Atlit-9R]RLM71882.1 hypothetical protein DVK08_07185 [Halorubrum sp. Atlit-9R]RLM82833.1 hypothetical protein DVK05_03320 [Halorubrum sp. Atlit-8R]